MTVEKVTSGHHDDESDFAPAAGGAPKDEQQGKRQMSAATSVPQGARWRRAMAKPRPRAV